MYSIALTTYLSALKTIKMPWFRKTKREIDLVGEKTLIEQLRKKELRGSIVSNADVARELASKRSKSTTPHNSSSPRKSRSTHNVGMPPQLNDWER